VPSGPETVAPSALAAVLPPGGLTLVSSTSAHSDLLHQMVGQAGDGLGKMRFAGVFVAGLNRAVWQAGQDSRTLTFFQTPELRQDAARVDFLPLSYSQIARYFAQHPPDAVLFMCAPPDEDGNCSFGVECSFVADLWSAAKTRIAHVNPAMPRTRGDRGIPWHEITAAIEAPQTLRALQAGQPDQDGREIARHLAPFIRDGAVIQTGLGKVPDAVLDILHDHKGLRIHSGLVGDGVLNLASSGALAGGVPILAGTAIGSEALYDAVAQDFFEFRPVSITHDVARMAAHEHFVAINSALQVDLFGQAYSEVTNGGAMSGPGGASEFAQGARLSRHGLSIVALPSTAKGGQISRIVAPADALGPVALSRLSIDLVVTEHGVADFRDAGHEERAEQLIAIAAPQFRSHLASAWSDIEQGL